MSAHTDRAYVRLLFAAAAVALAALTLTACKDGEGLRDEGPSSAGVPSATSVPGASPAGAASASGLPGDG